MPGEGTSPLGKPRSTLRHRLSTVVGCQSGVFSERAGSRRNGAVPKGDAQSMKSERAHSSRSPTNGHRFLQSVNAGFWRREPKILDHPTLGPFNVGQVAQIPLGARDGITRGQIRQRVGKTSGMRWGTSTAGVWDTASSVSG